MPLSPFYRKNLETQGFQCAPADFGKAAGWLRLNPAICITLIVTGLALQSSTIFFVLAAIAALGLFLPNSPGDYIYLYFIRPVTKTPPLPTTPPPRRFACLVGTAWALAIAFSFMAGAAALASALGIVFVLVALPMATVHFCIASVIYQKLIGYRPASLP